MDDHEQHSPLAPDRIVDPRSKPYSTPRWRGNLPHIYKEGCTYFATFCLIDAVPKHMRRKRLSEADENPELIARKFDPAPNTGGCLLEDHRAGSLVEDALLHFQGRHYALSAWCVMPNHVHVVVTPYAGIALPKIFHSWKSFSAHEINKALEREGSVWEAEAFDHLVRNERAFEQFVEYTESNPVVGGLCERPEDWPFSSARYRSTQE
jgi:REP element-mobilizing transposase RayT